MDAKRLLSNKYLGNVKLLKAYGMVISFATFFVLATSSGTTKSTYLITLDNTTRTQTGEGEKQKQNENFLSEFY